jgi:hypothetical protein
VGALVAPVAIAVADDNNNTNVIPTPAAEAAQIDQEQLNTVDLKRDASRTEARREASAERKAKAKKRAKKLARKQGTTGASTQTAGGSAAPPHLQAIAACESGGNPRTDTGNGFYGKYQFTLDTWQAVGGAGNPAQASEAEQDRRAAMLYAQAGPGQWPVCGG